MQAIQRSKHCLVTGATGFLGTNLVHQLVKQGWHVRASGMHGSETRYIDHLPIEFVFADITKPEEVDDLAKDCDVVFHVAGDTSFWKKQFNRQRAINVDGTLNVANACKKNKVKRLIHTSTLDVLGYNPSGGSYDEKSGRYNFNNMGYNYGDTKYEAEQKLRTYESETLEIVYMYPGFMVGPYDYTLQFGRVFFDLKNGTLPGLIPGGGSYCHVKEVANAHIQAAIKGRPSEGYLCAGMPHTNLPHAKMFEHMAKALDTKAPKFGIPKWAFVAYGYACEMISSFTNKAPDMNPGQARYMACPQYAISEKAIKELDYNVPNIDTCIHDALNWYRDNGFSL